MVYRLRTVPWHISKVRLWVRFPVQLPFRVPGLGCLMAPVTVLRQLLHRGSLHHDYRLRNLSLPVLLRLPSYRYLLLLLLLLPRRRRSNINSSSTSRRRRRFHRSYRPRYPLIYRHGPKSLVMRACRLPRLSYRQSGRVPHRCLLLRCLRLYPRLQRQHCSHSW